MNIFGISVIATCIDFLFNRGVISSSYSFQCWETRFSNRIKTKKKTWSLGKIKSAWKWSKDLAADLPLIKQTQSSLIKNEILEIFGFLNPRSVGKLLKYKNIFLHAI